MMDVHASSQTPLLFLTFFQQSPSLNHELQCELKNLQSEVKFSSAPSSGFSEHIPVTRYHVFNADIECDGELQTDGHALNIGLLHDAPEVEIVLPVPAEEANAVAEVAAELVRMADEFNQGLISQAADRLTKKLSSSPPAGWYSCLSQGVDGLLNTMPGVDNERMVMALTFSLVKAVCERTPRFLRGLYNTITQINARP